MEHTPLAQHDSLSPPHSTQRVPPPISARHARLVGSHVFDAVHCCPAWPGMPGDDAMQYGRPSTVAHMSPATHVVPPQHGCPSPPHGSHATRVPPVTHARLALHAGALAQHGWSTAPHAAHVPAAHTAPRPQADPVQHGWPGAPHARHTEPALHTRLAPDGHVAPAQQGWPSPPQPRHVPPWQESPAPLHVVPPQQT